MVSLPTLPAPASAVLFVLRVACSDGWLVVRWLTWTDAATSACSFTRASSLPSARHRRFIHYFYWSSVRFAIPYLRFSLPATPTSFAFSCTNNLPGSFWYNMLFASTSSFTAAPLQRSSLWQQPYRSGAVAFLLYFYRQRLPAPRPSSQPPYHSSNSSTLVTGVYLHNMLYLFRTQTIDPVGAAMDGWGVGGVFAHFADPLPSVSPLLHTLPAFAPLLPPNPSRPLPCPHLDVVGGRSVGGRMILPCLRDVCGILRPGCLPLPYHKTTRFYHAHSLPPLPAPPTLPALLRLTRHLAPSTYYAPPACCPVPFSHTPSSTSQVQLPFYNCSNARLQHTFYPTLPSTANLATGCLIDDVLQPASTPSTPTTTALALLDSCSNTMSAFTLILLPTACLLPPYHHSFFAGFAA